MIQIETVTGKDSTLDFGYKKDNNARFLHLIFIDIGWEKVGERKIFAFGIPFLFSIGFFYKSNK